MKTLAVWLLFSSAALSAPSLPNFSEKLEKAPELSLSEAIKTGHISRVDFGLFAPPMSVGRVQPSEKKYISRMPVITPKEVDRKMPIVAPDSSSDFKMTVIDPKVEPAK